MNGAGGPGPQGSQKKERRMCEKCSANKAVAKCSVDQEGAQPIVMLLCETCLEVEKKAREAQEKAAASGGAKVKIEIGKYKPPKDDKNDPLDKAHELCPYVCRPLTLRTGLGSEQEGRQTAAWRAEEEIGRSSIVLARECVCVCIVLVRCLSYTECDCVLVTSRRAARRAREVDRVGEEEEGRHGTFGRLLQRRRQTAEASQGRDRGHGRADCGVGGQARARLGTVERRCA
jgi:hypothetical protein